MRDPRITRLAEVLVQYSVGVKKGQFVRIRGPVVSSPLIKEIYAQVIQAGGFPRVVVELKELEEIFFKTAGDEQLDFVDPVSKFEMEKIISFLS